MRRMFLLVGLLVVSAISCFAGAGVTSITVSTYAVTDSAFMEAQIDGKVDISEITISNGGAVAQEVSIYELGDSTTTVSLIAGPYYIPATAHYYKIVDLDYYERWNVEDFCIRKSSTGSVVTAIVTYQ